MVSVLFLLAFFPFPCRLKKRKLPPGRLTQWLSGSVFRLHCTGRVFDSHTFLSFSQSVLKIRIKVRKMVVTAFH